jgi:hypothetical protein
MNLLKKSVRKNGKKLKSRKKIKKSKQRGGGGVCFKDDDYDLKKKLLDEVGKTYPLFIYLYNQYRFKNNKDEQEYILVLMQMLTKSLDKYNNSPGPATLVELNKTVITVKIMFATKFNYIDPKFT